VDCTNNPSGTCNNNGCGCTTGGGCSNSSYGSTCLGIVNTCGCEGASSFALHAGLEDARYLAHVETERHADLLRA
jgi:hypothetical protein